MKTRLLRLFGVVLLFAAAVMALTSMHLLPSLANGPCVHWYHCPVTQEFSRAIPEHGIDLETHGLVITALLSGTVTFDREMSWDGTGVQDITWRVDAPWLAKGFKYAYVQIHRYSSYVHVGEHINVGAALGVSDGYMEFGLSTSWAYGYAGDWSKDWTTDPRFLL